MLDFKIKLLSKIGRLIFFFSQKMDLPKKNDVGICMLLCHRDVTMSLFSLESLFSSLGYQLPIFIVSDGTLTKNDIFLLKNTFDTIVLNSNFANKKMHRLLKKHPNTFQNRFSTVNGKYKLKLDAIFLNPFKRFIFLEPDILFLNKNFIEQWIKNNSPRYLHTAHYESTITNSFLLELSLRKSIFKYLKVKIEPGFNSGLLFFPAHPLQDLRLIETIYSYFNEISLLNFDGLDDLALSVFFDRKKSKCLPKDKYLVVSSWAEFATLKENFAEAKSIHFAYQVKEKLYQFAFQQKFKQFSESRHFLNK